MSVQRQTKIILRDDVDDSALVVELLNPRATSDDDTRIVSFNGDSTATWVTWATLREFAEALLSLLPPEEKSWAHSISIEPPD